MPALLLPLTFTILFLLLLSHGNRGVRTAFMETTIVFSLTAVFITESLGAGRWIEPVPVLSAWTLILLLSSYLAYERRDHIGIRTRSAYLDASSRIRKMSGFQKSMWGAVITLTLLLLVQGIAYPSNSTDTLMYHLPRVVSWIGQRSVDHFPSSIYRQVYMPPFAEYLVMNVNILSGSDRYCNTVEWFFLTACAVAATRLTDLLLTGRGSRAAAHLLAVCLPVAVLQSSTANNDIVASFFVLTSFFYGYRWLEKPKPGEGVWLGASFGLACLTKATVYLYLAPMVFLLVADTLRRLFREGMGPVKRAIVPVILFAVVLANVYARNLDLTGNPLGLDQNRADPHVNEVFSIGVTVSNAIKILGGQIGPYPLNSIYDSAVTKAHRVLDFPIQTPGTHFGNLSYRGAPNLPSHDSTAPNTLYTCLLLAALAWMILGRRVSGGESPAMLKLHAAIIVLQFFLFSVYLKWHPWHTRLLMPLYFLCIPLLCHALGSWKPSGIIEFTGLLLIFGTALFATAFNDARPFHTTSFTHGVSLSDHRFDRFFTERYRPLSGEMGRIKGIMDSGEMKAIGLIIDGGMPEHILFHDAYKRKTRPVHLDVRNASGRLDVGQRQADCIVTDTVSDSAIVRGGRTYRNITPEHRKVWLFK